MDDFKNENIKLGEAFAWNPVDEALVGGTYGGSCRDSIRRSQSVENVEDSEFLPEYPEHNNFTFRSFSLHDPEDRTRFPFFRYMRIRKKLGVCSLDHPKRIFNCNELLEIADAIQDAIISPEGQKVRPRFFGTRFSNQMLIIIVGDTTTADRVKSLPGRLKTPNNLQFKIKEQSVGKKTFRVRGKFKRTGNDSNEKILKYLEVQNVGIDFSNWRVVDRQIEKKGINFLTFEIDWDSVQKLKDRGPGLNYKMGSVMFTMDEIPNTPVVENKIDDDSGPWVDVIPPSLPFFGPDQQLPFAFYSAPGCSNSNPGQVLPSVVPPELTIGSQVLQNPFANEPGNYKRPVKNKGGNFKKWKNKKQRMKEKIKKQKHSLTY